MPMPSILKSFALLTGTAIAALSALTASATAADVLPPANTWTGWYVGAGAGYGMNNHEIILTGRGEATADGEFLGMDFNDGDIIAGSLNFSGIGGEGPLGTLRTGYDWQVSDKWLVGAMADFDFSGISTDISANIGGDTASYTLSSHSASLLGRVGHIQNDSTLFYFLGGWTRSWFEGDVSSSFYNANYDFTTDGLTLGSGIENVIADNVTLSFEHRYTRNQKVDIYTLPETQIGNALASGSLGAKTNVQTIRAVLAYRPGVKATPLDGSQAKWTGLHGGIGAGYGMLNHVIDIGAGGLGGAEFSGIGGEGFLGTAELGADKLLGERYVVGLAADYTYSNAATTLDFNLTGLPDPVGNVSASYDLTARNNFNLLARAGVLTGPDVLWYGLAGWTRTGFHGKGQASYTGNGGGSIGTSYKFTSDGLTVGGGVEVMLNDKLSWKGEYRYTHYEAAKIFAVDDFSLEAPSNAQSVRSVLSYRF